MQAKNKSRLVATLAVFLIWGGILYAHDPPASLNLRDLGGRIYQRACSYCHGERGKGDGKAVRYLFTRPRDFTSGKFKVRSTPTGSLPTDEDLFHTITVGFPQYGMPRFEYLTPRERRAVIQYIKTFSPPSKLKEAIRPIEIGRPPKFTTSLLSQGRQLYVDAGCVECHGRKGKGNGPSASGLKDDWGHESRPLDFTKGPTYFKGGARARDLLRTLLTGMTGTPMPSYADIFTNEQAWALVYYIEGLAKKAQEK